ncbi:MAG: cytochrome c-type biosis protein CcmH [Alphaproteobacteria bacterium]|jgi:cytochrome c-type biogenesis protein CcmH|nr:cytochrome c-type biosis protein CcmH [Alphaproteobacteria bacterium]
MAWLRYVALVLAVMAASTAFAVQPDEVLPDPALESRARALSQQLRCLVCQNQSIDDSEAPLARDLRILLRERLKGGDDDRQVLDFLVVRYGEFVLLKPPFAWHTALLWLGPPALLLAGALVLIVLARRRSGQFALAHGLQDRLTPEEEARLVKLVDND